MNQATRDALRCFKTSTTLRNNTERMAVAVKKMKFRPTPIASSPERCIGPRILERTAAVAASGATAAIDVQTCITQARTIE